MRGLSRVLRRLRILSLVFVALVVALPAGPSPLAQTVAQGFQLNRYEPTAAGETSLSVDHPWFSATRYVAAGLTLNYANKPLVSGFYDPATDTFTRRSAVIEHQLVAHVDLAGSLFDRVTLAASLPVVLLEQGAGSPSFGVTPLASVMVGDPRLSLVVRLFGQPDGSPVSLSLAGSVWIPLRGSDPGLPAQLGDAGVRVHPRLVFAGLAHRVRWSAVLGFVHRPDAILGAGSGDTEGRRVGPSVQLGGLIQYADAARRFALGPELVLSTIPTEGRGFRKDFTSLELLFGGHVNVVRQIQIGAGLGVGLLREPGTPDLRAMLRLSYAPVRVVKVQQPVAAKPKVVAPPPPPPPPPPPKDTDGDGVPDDQDLCKEEAAGGRPDPQRAGCPLQDVDGDGVYPPDDLCPDKAQGPVPDPKQVGCPAGDEDGDQVLDPQDACPTQTGAPHVDPQKNGCPGLVAIKGQNLVIATPVYFATAKDKILPKSYPVLQAVADALLARPALVVEVEGHTDNKGQERKNAELSKKRAASVVRWLVEHGVATERLSAKGYGSIRPIADNKKATGRDLNRRVEFRIVQ